MIKLNETGEVFGDLVPRLDMRFRDSAKENGEPATTVRCAVRDAVGGENSRSSREYSEDLIGDVWRRELSAVSPEDEVGTFLRRKGLEASLM